VLIRMWSEIPDPVRDVAVLEGVQALSVEERALLAHDVARVTKTRFIVVSRRTVRDQAREAARFFTRLRPQMMGMVLSIRYRSRVDLYTEFNRAVGIEGAPEPVAGVERDFTLESFVEFERKFGRDELCLAVAFASDYGRIDCRRSAGRLVRQLLSMQRSATMQERAPSQPAVAEAADVTVVAPPAESTVDEADDDEGGIDGDSVVVVATVEEAVREAANAADNGAQKEDSDKAADAAVVGATSEDPEPIATFPHSHDAARNEVRAVVGARRPPRSPEDWSIPEQRDDVLDRIVIRAIVASLNQEVGSLKREEIAELIKTVVSMNVTRFRSYFYIGFDAALNGAALAGPTAGWNQPRRAWYLAGYLLGARRALSGVEFLQIVGKLDTRDLESFEDPNARGAAQKVAPTIIEAACEKRDFPRIIEWLRLMGPCDRRAVRTLTAFALHGSRELTTGFAHLLQELLVVYRRLPESKSTDETIEAVSRLLLALAACIREGGAAARARDTLQMAPGPWSAEQEAEALLAELTMVLGVSDAASLVPQSEDALRGLVARLSTHGLDEDKLEAAPGYALFELMAALSVVASDRTFDQDLAQQLLERADGTGLRLRSAVSGRWYATVRADEFDRALTTLSALFSLCVGIETRAASAVGTIESWLASGAKLPQPLVKMALENAAILDCPGLASLYAEAVRKLGVEVLEDDALVRSAATPQGRKWLLELLKEPSFAIAPERRWFICAEVGRTAARNPDGEELAVQCLEVLQDLVEQYPKRFGTELISELGRDEWAPVLDEDESDEVRGWVGRLCGDWSVVGDSLANQFRRAVASEDFGLASDFLDLMDSAGHANRVAEAEREWVRSRTRPAAPLAADAPRVRVLFVGGNEVQARGDRQNEQWLTANAPGVFVEWLHTGWGSNWDKFADDVERKLRSTDAIVLMKFVRTKLGEEVRRLASEQDIPWIPCTGHGMTSVRRAILKAATVVREG